MLGQKRLLMTVLLMLVGIYVLLCALLYAGQEKMLFPAYRLPESYTFHFPDPFEEVFWEAKTDKARQNALFFSAGDSSRGALLYLHGNGGALDQWGELAPTFTRQGLSVLIPDYRGYGKSQGKRKQALMLSDALEAYDFLVRKCPGKPVYVFGRSLGSGFASYVASQRKVEALLLESPYYSIKQVAQGRFPWLPVAPLIRFPMPSYSYISGVDAPVYIIHGAGDRVIPVTNSRQLSEVVSGRPVTYVEVPGAHHNDLGTFPVYADWLARALN